MTLTLESNRSDQTLYLGCLVSLMFAFFLGKSSLNDILSNVVLFGKVVQLADLPNPLWAQSTWLHFVRESRDIGVPLADNDEIEHTQTVIDNAAVDRLTPPLSGTSRSETAVSLLEEQLDAASSEYTLLHWETLFVISTTDANNVSLCVCVSPKFTLMSNEACCIRSVHKFTHNYHSQVMHINLCN